VKQAHFEKTFQGWRDCARQFVLDGISPDQINWSQEELSLFTSTSLNETKNLSESIKNLDPKNLTVPPDFIKLATAVSYARNEGRWSLLYRILYRLQNENPNLLKINIDPDIHEAEQLKKSVSHDIHKMHAFVRFKKAIINEEEIYVAWHRPEHLIVRPGTEFFARRFGDRKWSIFTPDESAHWDLKNLTFGPGIEQNEFVATDNWDEVWKTYYKSIFNPARIKIKMMKSEMSPKYWSSMPETSLIQDLVREAPQRLQAMAANQNHAAVVKPNLNLSELRESAKVCKACPLHANVTQTVFGIGPEQAEIMIVGEQPGDEEDLSGNPFVGPSGKILTEALHAAGIEKEKVYITNAVKHFKWAPRGKLRMHQKPTGQEMHACKPWLEAEIARVKPKVILALGATAATAITGKLPKITEERGKVITSLNVAPAVIISWHPAAILRSFTPEEMQQRRDQLFQDIQLAINAVSDISAR
jgi:uracil-DNA glycosylase